MFSTARAIARVALLAAVPMALTVTTAAQPAAAAQYQYRVQIVTSKDSGAGTDGNVWIVLLGDKGESKETYMDSPGNDFEAGSSAWYTITTDKSLGHVSRVKVRHTTGPFNDKWKLELLYVDTPGSDAYNYFPCVCWFGTEHRIIKEVDNSDDD